MSKFNDKFEVFSAKVTKKLGSSTAFLIAFLIVLVWALVGPVFGFSAGWQLLINTGTTIVTFLMVFIIQQSQNKDTLALHAKLDELIRASNNADNNLRRIEDLTESEITKIRLKDELDKE